MKGRAPDCGGTAFQIVGKVFCYIFFASAEGFAPAGATKGLSDRPLETFGPITCGRHCRLGERKVLSLADQWLRSFFTFSRGGFRGYKEAFFGVAK